MPSKKSDSKTVAVAYTAKCTNCLKKHGPPLHGDCLALITPDLAKLAEEQVSDDLDPDEVELTGAENGDDQTHSDNAVAGVLEGAKHTSGADGAVAAQLKNVEVAIAGLAAMFQNTRSEVADLCTVVMANQTVLSSLASNASLVPQVPVAPVSAVSSISSQSEQGVVGGPAGGSQAFVPILTALRGDTHLTAQAEQLVTDISTSVAGIPSFTTQKRGMVRSGGDLSPAVKTPWPQDFVLGSGKKVQLYYEDLSIYEWIIGYITIVQIQSDPIIQRHMFDHLKNLMEDAVFFGWEPVKQAHKAILTSLESGTFTWTDELKMAEKRRSAINRASQVRETPPLNKNGSQGRFQGSFQQSQNNGSRNVVGKKLIKPCAYYNSNVCSKRSDHEGGNIFYRHICSNCFSPEHTVKECGFLSSTT
jgi:hypothetical protein